MLILSRKPKESLVIQDNIVVTVLAIDGDKVKLGITAPREVTILRQELWLAVQEQNQIAENLARDPEPASFDGLRAYLAAEAPASLQDDPPEGDPPPEAAQQDTDIGGA